MPILATLLVLLTAPAPVDRDIGLAEVEAPATTDATDAPSDVPAPPAPTTATTPTMLALDPTPMPAPPPRPPARPDRPIRWRVDVVGDLGGTVLRDRAWRGFGPGAHALLPGLSLRADARLGGGRLFLGGGASFRRLGGGASLYEQPWTEARVREPLLFARLAVVAIEGVDVFMQLGGGPSVVDLGFFSTQSASQRAVAGMVDGQGGLAIYLPKRRLRRRGAARVTGGLEVAAGYTWRSNIAVRPTVDTQPEPIATSAARLGDLSLRGLVWRLGLFVRFQ